MTVAAKQGTQNTGVSGYLPALMSARTPQADDGSLLWPEWLRCDLIDAPLDACCGVIAHLARADAEVCPVAQIADRLLFLVAEGSSATCGVEIEGLPAGVVLAGAVERFPDRGNGGPAGGCSCRWHSSPSWWPSCRSLTASKPARRCRHAARATS